MPESSDGIHRKDIEWLRNRLAVHIGNFRGSRRWYRARAKWFGVSGAIFSGATTVFVALQQINGIDGNVKIFIGIIALVLSASAAVVASLENFFESKKLWIRYTSTLNGLYELSDKLEYQLSKDDGLSPDKLDKIFDNLQALLSENNADWASARASSGKIVSPEKTEP